MKTLDMMTADEVLCMWMPMIGIYLDIVMLIIRLIQTGRGSTCRTGFSHNHNISINEVMKDFYNALNSRASGYGLRYGYGSPDSPFFPSRQSIDDRLDISISLNGSITNNEKMVLQVMRGRSALMPWTTTLLWIRWRNEDLNMVWQNHLTHITGFSY